jgi:hypothetical protein
VNLPSLTCLITAFLIAFLFSSKLTTPAAPWKSFKFANVSLNLTESVLPFASKAFIKIK